MPTKNNPIDLSAGTLYIRHPETGETLPCGPLKSLEVEHTHTDYVDDLGVVNPTLAPRSTEWTATIEVDADSILLQAIQTATKIRACVAWARNERPRLVHLIVHTKKRRTRKKNAVRIVREYLKEVKT